MRHLRFLRYVDEVARAGSIRKAAEQLHVTASAVNRRVMDLEEELGAPLFERRARGVRLTAAGELFVRYIREQSGDVERMKSQIEDLKACGAAPCASPAARRSRSISCRARSRPIGRSFRWCSST
jgi:DNA-binding transcriptional LysR family regulator